MSVTLSDGMVYQVWQDAQVKPYLTRNRVTYQDLLPGTRVLAWADDKGQASKVIVFPYEYKGSLSLDSYGRLYINSGAAGRALRSAAALQGRAAVCAHPGGGGSRRIQRLLG